MLIPSASSLRAANIFAETGALKPTNAEKQASSPYFMLANGGELFQISTFQVHLNPIPSVEKSAQSLGW